MGLRLTRKQRTPEEIAYEFRRQNDKITLKIQKIISKSYRHGLLTELEYNCTLGYFYGLRSRHALIPEPAFLNTLDHLHEYLAELIQQRGEDLKANAPARYYEPSAPEVDLSDPEVAARRYLGPPSPALLHGKPPSPHDIFEKIIDHSSLRRG